MISIVVQICIGFVFTVYGGYSLLRGRGTGGRLPLFLACVLAGLFLLGYAADRVL
nr:hypothetical protein [uncultured Oscillibacter sp.]